MPRRIDEDDLTAVDFNVIGADVLRDAAGFAPGHIGFADSVEQRRLAVIDVTHDGNDRRAVLAIALCLGLLNGLDRLFLVAHLRGLGPELASEIDGHFDVERLVDGRENLAFKERLDNQAGLYAELVGEFLHRDAFRDGDLAVDHGQRSGFLLARTKSPEFAFAVPLPVMLLAALLSGVAATCIGSGRRWRLHHRRGRVRPSPAHGRTAAGTHRIARPART